MLDFGKELKAAREAKGLTIANIAETTHIMSAVIEDLENENFSRIVAPIYGRGFVKLYCEAVGLDPKPFVAEFMEIYNGRRDPAIRERAVVPPPIPETNPIAEPEPTPQPEPTPVEDNYDDRQPTPDEQDQAPVPSRPTAVSLCSAASSATGADNYDERLPSEPAPEPEPVPPPQPSLFDPPSTWAAPKAPVEKPAIRSFYETPEASPLPATDEPPTPAKPRFTRYSAPLSDRFADVTELGPTILRWAVLAIVALGVLWGVVAGIRALYRATTMPSETSQTGETSQPSETSEPSETSATSQPSAPRTPLAVPPLYID